MERWEKEEAKLVLQRGGTSGEEYLQRLLRPSFNWEQGRMSADEVETV